MAFALLPLPSQSFCSPADRATGLTLVGQRNLGALPCFVLEALLVEAIQLAEVQGGLLLPQLLLDVCKAHEAQLIPYHGQLKVAFLQNYVHLSSWLAQRRKGFMLVKLVISAYISLSPCLDRAIGSQQLSADLQCSGLEH